MINIECRNRQGREIRGEGDLADSLEPEMHLNAGGVSTAHEDRAIRMAVVIEIGRNQRWTEQTAGEIGRRTDPRKCFAQSILCMESGSYREHHENRDTSDQRAHIEHVLTGL